MVSREFCSAFVKLTVLILVAAAAVTLLIGSLCVSLFCTAIRVLGCGLLLLGTGCLLVLLRMAGTLLFPGKK